MRADPADGFPIGTPLGLPETVSWHSFGHVISGFIGFIGLIVACFVLARRFGRENERGWSRFSLITGIVYILGLVGLGAGAGTAVVNLGFTVAVIVGWTWLTLLMVRTRTEEIR
jgi:ABC-type Fe3+-siderophore transport system permease subunit